MLHDIAGNTTHRKESAWARRRFAWMQLPANERTDTIGPDEKIAGDGFPACQCQLNAGWHRRETRGFRRQFDGIEPDRLQQRAVQHWTQDAHRIFVEECSSRSRVEAAKHGAVRPPHVAARGHEATLPCRFCETQRAKRVHGIRSEQKRETELSWR
jgi:hypothetical protein